MREKGKTCEDCGKFIPKGYTVPDDGMGNCAAGGTHHHLEDLEPLETIKKGEEEWNESKLSKRITASETFAINHGFEEWKGIDVSEWHKQNLKAILTSLASEERGEMVSETHTNGRPILTAKLRAKRIGHNQAKQETIDRLEVIIKSL